MGLISDKGHTAWRRYETDNVPASGENEPDKAEVIDFVDEVDAEVIAVQTAIAQTNALVLSLQQIGAGGMIGYPTKVLMNADLNHPDGTLAQVSYATDPANAGTYRKSGASGTGSWVSFPTVVDVLGPDIPKTMHVYFGAAAGGNGSTSSPYNATDAIASINADPSRRSIELILRGGVFRIPTLRFDCNRWREVTIRAALGMNADIYCSEAVGAGTAIGFTRPDAVGAPNVWMTANKWNTTLNSTVAPGNLIDLTHSSACGRSGVFRSPSTLYTDLGNDISLGVINGAAYRGCTSLQTTGPNAGKLYVHALADADPNTITFERTVYDFGIWADAPVGTDFNGCRVNLSGVRVFYGGDAGIWLDRCQVDVENVAAGFGHNYGFNFNQCDGIVAEAFASYNATDGFNGNGAIADASAPGHHAKLTLLGCVSQGIQQMVVPPVVTPQVGDGFSNHGTQDWHLIDCVSLGATKDGGSMGDACTFNNFFAEDAADAGIKLGCYYGYPVVAEVAGGRLKGCREGLMVTTGAPGQFPAGGTATINARDTILENTADRDLYATGALPCTINALDVRFVGPIPPSGRKVQDTSGTINIRSSSRAADPKPVTVTTPTHTQGEDELSLVFATAATHTSTLLDPVAHPGVRVRMKNTAAFAINSATANVVPLAGGAAAVAILPAAAGKWVELESDGAAWVVMSGN